MNETLQEKRTGRIALVLALLSLGWLAFVLCGCVTDEDEARETLDQAGFNNIHVGDVTYFGCGKGDKYGREFKAVNANGHTVTGYVCCGVLKGCTVRF